MGVSKFHQYPEFSDNVYARYIKTVIHSIGGMRYNPETNKQQDYFLSTPEERFDFQSKTLVGEPIYDDEVLEIYSANEDKFFRRNNKSFFDQGVLIAYHGQAEEIDTTNILDDVEVQEIASLTNLKATEKRVSELTSILPLQRILNTMDTLGRKDSFRAIVRKRIEEIDATP